MNYIDDIYLTLQGQLTEEAKVPWVETVWIPGSFCDRQYGQMLEACGRLCDRLGVEEDADVEQIIDSLLRIQQELCREMFLCGMRYRDLR